MEDAAEMAQLATQLGQEFEARAFLRIAVAVDPDRSDLRNELARLNRQPGPIDRSGRTLGQVLAPELALHPIRRVDRQNYPSQYSCPDHRDCLQSDWSSRSN